jgi:hypothetical protein
MGGISTRVDTDYSYLLKKDVKKEVVETVEKEEPEVLGDAAPAEPVNQEEVFEVPTVQFADEDPVITEENASSSAVLISTEDINDPVTADSTPAEPLRAKQETKEEKVEKSTDTKKKGGRKKKN